MKNPMNKVLSGNQLLNQVTIPADDALFALLGTDDRDQQMVWPVGREELSRHMLLLGGIGTGKSNAFNLIIQRIRHTLNSNDVMIIFDTKGDYYNEFYRPGDVVISNDERATGGNGADYWNIFNEICIDDRVEENTLEICKTLFSEKLEKTTQPFFPNAAKDLLQALMMYLLRTENCRNMRNNASLRNVLDTFSVPAMLNILRAHTDTKAMESYISDPKSGQTLGVVAELQQMVREIFVGNFAKKGTLSMRQLVHAKGGRVIFVEYDLGIGGMLTPVYRLLMDLAIKEALCRKTNEGNVYFMIDEFRLLPHLTHVDDGVNFGRSLGAKFFLGVQNIEQVFHAYGEDLGRSILSGFSTMIAFRVADGTTREYIKEIFGKNRSLVVYESGIKSRGIIENMQETHVVEDWDIGKLRVGEAIVGYADYQPFRFRFKRYVSMNQRG